jgi:uncharacterized protein (DUF58 family)
LIMVRTRPTTVGKIFLALMLLFYVASVTSQSGLLLFFIGLIGGCFVVNWFFAGRHLKHVSVKAPESVHLVEGEAASQPWRLENLSQKNVEGLEIWGETGFMFRLPLLRPGDAQFIVPDLIYEARGVFPNAEVVIKSAAPFGLVCAARRLKLTGETIVVPRVYEAIAPAANGLETMSGGKFRGGRRVNSGSHFAGVRSWEAGDSLKQVHWKTTAHRDQLMVKTFEEELGGRLSLVLDCSGGNIKLVDDAVRAAASLGVAALQDGHQMEFFDLNEPAALRLAPFSDENDFLDRLARFAPPAAGTTPNLNLFWRKSAVALIGTEWREQWHDLIAEAQKQNRSVEVYLPEGSPAAPDVDAKVAYFNDREIWPNRERLVGRQ